jgi:phosphoglycolate phosphatase-like HAD superfamily hydrolase
MKTLLLWDIDGTLLASAGAGLRALVVALSREYGIEGHLDDIDWSGRTDRFITRQIFAKYGLPPNDESFQRYLDAYVAALPEEMARAGSRVLPGIPELLERAAGDDTVAQGLLTGNIRRGAEAKLGYHGLWDYFPFGAFANDSETRNDLGPHALRRATESTGVSFAPDRVWIIGDTPHDIACGKVIGARTLALATGHHPIEELAAHQPTAMLASLADVDHAWRLLTE